MALKPAVLATETEPPLPSTISAMPRKMIWVDSVTIIGGSSGNRVSMKALTRPQQVPTASVASITSGNGAPALLMIQAIVAARHTVEPTEMSISPMTSMKAITSIRKTSAR